ncbi:CoA transferase [Rhizobiaceae bacterium BDR2-2]|uniref:CoA transferase n=1 Tax=Ectorhizobium quercum TaxID=2965071 RepID=A0AAE3MZK0_9HYPH|nr:CoA transferase [Ectorhizobium quercum]MCX8997201.1 CoA transferase [Ectorhizobium quercum]
MNTDLPLQGIRVAEIASGVAAAYAGRLLAAMGADVVMVEPPGASPLRREPPFLGPDSTESALFAYLAAGKRSVICDLAADCGRADCDRLLSGMDMLIDDTPVMRRAALGLDPARIAARHPRLVHLSVLPFGAFGPKAGWKGSELNVMHASGEGFLLPNGLSADLFPDRPPLKIAGHFAEMQGGIAAALAGLAALWSGKGQFVDVSAQDATVAVGAFTVQRYGDGSLEHRASRSFRYGGVIACRDGYVELLTLEERQWHGLVELLGRPDWATDPALADPAERSARGDALNARIRAWALDHDVDELVAGAQKLGVPMARYNAPEQVLAGRHEQARGLFAEIAVPGGGTSRMQTGPFRFGPHPLPVRDWPSEAGADQHLLDRAHPVVAGQSQREHA